MMYMNLHDAILAVFEAIPWLSPAISVGLAVIPFLAVIRMLNRVFLLTPAHPSSLISSGKVPQIEPDCIESVKEFSSPKEEAYYQ